MWIGNLLVGLLALLAGFGVESFNVETRHFTMYRQEKNSMFGFSVSEYKDSASRGWVIVGAPEAQTSQPEVIRGGAVYRCDIAVDDHCAIIEFDNKGNNYNVDSQARQKGITQVDNKTLQWFGASVSASMENGGPIMACAPRYVWFSVTMAGRDPVGTCWVTNFTNSQEFSPCRTRHWGYHRQGSCQAGIGAAVSKDGERVFIGAPGSWYWQGQTFSQSVKHRPRVMFTKEGPAEEDDSYMGYSVTSGDFTGDGDSGVAVGMPRGAGLRGKVILFNSNMTNQQNVTGEQMGAYFGYAIASGDIDGDGLDDLIIGAPMYTVSENPEMTYETGRIYVVYQGGGPKKFRKVDMRDGTVNRARFGHALASLGDIDRDGYGDFAVGAPYGGAEGRGSVYIYHGSREGVLEKYSQAILAEDLRVPVETFGFSLAGGLDLDGNLYPDMVVGSYDSSTAMFFRSRPVIKMDSYVEFNSESKLISLDTKECLLSDRTSVTCLPLTACFTYSGEGILPRHDFNIQYVLDVKKSKNPRLFFLELEGRNTMTHPITVERDVRFCRTVKVYVAPNIRDKLTSLDAEMRMSLSNESFSDTGPRDPRMILRPVLGTTTSRKDTLSIRKNCGPDNVCVPDLQLIVRPNVDRYLLGSGRRLELDVLVQNEGEDAFEAMYNLQLPPGIDYIKIERIDKTEIPVQCSAPKQSNNNTLRCDIGNPLPQKKLVHFVVLLQPVTSQDMKPTYEFEMEVNTTNPEEHTTADNIQHLSLPIWIETELLVEGESKPKDLYYNPENYTAEAIQTELEFGPAVIHNYTIRNLGPSGILEAEAFLVWPAQTLAGDELVYLLEQPETSGPMACESANANYLSLKLDHRRRMHYNIADSSGLVLEESNSGSTINVQRGTELSEADRKRLQTEESEVNSSGSSGIERTRQRTQMYKQGPQVNVDNSKVLNTTYHREEVTNRAGHRVVVHTDSGRGSMETGTSTLGGAPLLPRPSLSEDNYRATTTWRETPAGTTESLSESDTSQMDRYAELKRIQEEQRRREEDRLALERRRLEEDRLAQERRRLEEDRVRQEESTREYVFGTKKHYPSKAEAGNRVYQHGVLVQHPGQSASGSQDDIRARNVSYVRRLQSFFGVLSEDSSMVRDYVEDRAGQLIVRFPARYRVAADGREFVEFKDGTKFVLKNQYGEDAYAVGGPTEWNTDPTFLHLEGRIVDVDGKECVQINDGRRFFLPNIYTRVEERVQTSGSQGVSSSSHASTNISSLLELEKFFSTLSKDAAAYNAFNRQGRQYILFDGRFRMSSDGKEYIEFRGGSRFPLQNSYGEPSIGDLNEFRDSRFLKMEGQLIKGQDGKDYIQLKDGRRFPLQSSYTYTEERKYTLGGGSREGGGKVYESGEDSWHLESSSRSSIDVDREYESHSSRSYLEEQHRSERRHDSRFYGRDPNADLEDEEPLEDTEASSENRRNYRHRRETDALDVEEFLDLERRSRLRRDGPGGLEEDYEDKMKPPREVAPCSVAKCVTLRCTLGPLEKDQEVWIVARYRVNARTLKKVALNEQVRISTQLVAHVVKQPFIGTPVEQVVKSHEIYTTVQPSAPPSMPDVVPLWVVVLSACAGTIILLLLIYLLHKCGFFKRNRPTDAPERQPLNRNGHFQHGDDHL
ncbi:integrin alpha-PS2 isoform X2 [Orussus abietinus]|uniref:integrin alpha-PS2 isoform X2 n=1 Tax=Orussus abietinus TaxID=222816 RepID=UPI0006268B86|nr:integrin alpha-PS2 isoform X2 [Orussus abietinus]